MPNPHHTSLRDSLLNAIGNFLYEEGFVNDGITKEGILEMINLTSDYHEEGRLLFPEVLITNNLDFFKTIPNKEIVITEASLAVNEFRNAIKLCAPLATNSWIIFIEVKGDKIKYGITSAEMSETSPSIYNQTVGNLKVDQYQGSTLAYIRNIGQKNVELVGLKNRLIISLSLNKPKEFSTNELEKLCETVSSGCEEKMRSPIKTFLEKTIDDALKSGHGNLIAVVKDSDDAVEALKQKITGNGGVYLKTPIDFELLITEAETNKNNETSINLKSYASILKGMLNHDGITIFTTKGKVVGYHLLIDNYVKEHEQVIGGARSRAFKSMENSDLFELCYYKSQDGAVKLWERI